MFAGLIFVPSFILAGVLFGMAFGNYIIYYKWLGVIPFSIAVGTYVIRDGLNEWWYVKHPPGLSDVEKNILARFFPYYRRLNIPNKKLFEDRLSVFRLQKKFQMRLLKKIPGDLQLLVCATGVQITMGMKKEKEYLDNLGMIVLFPKAFITPDINTQLHHVEVNNDTYDCLLLSIDMFSKGIQDVENFYNSGLHGMAKIFKMKYGYSDEDIPYENQKELLVKLHHLREFKIGFQFIYNGLPKMEIFEMCTEHFFQCPVAMQKALPKVYNYFMNVYHQDPANKTDPVIQQVITSSEDEETDVHNDKEVL
ncbi:MAG: hypothetical protein MK207_04325 [Saprospiraceae bacterium]|nr:hypothetical protein [Saprospiraceae bacterium]